MRRRHPRINWFLVIVVIILIAMVTYVDRFILPTAQAPFLPTPTATREPESYVTEAERLFDQGKLLQAIDAYNEAIRIKPDDSAVYIALARVQIFAGKYDEALVNAENSLLLNPNSSMAYAVRGWALTQKGNYTEADDSLKSAIQLDPNNGLAHAYNAFLYGKMFENNAGPYVDPIQTAIDESRTATTLAPNSLEAHWARAYILQITSNSPENREQAVIEYQNAITINNNISELHLELGVMYKALEAIDKALNEYLQASTLNPSDFRPPLYSSRALASIGEYEQAAQYAETAVNDAPTDPYLRGNWGYMLYKSNDFNGALPQLSLAINGGQSDDGQTILPLDPASTDVWVSTYYYAFAITLGRSNQCGDALLLTQKILDYYRADEYAIPNVEFALSFCPADQGATVAQPTVTPVLTPTP